MIRVGDDNGVVINVKTSISCGSDEYPSLISIQVGTSQSLFWTHWLLVEVAIWNLCPLRDSSFRITIWVAHWVWLLMMMIKSSTKDSLLSLCRFSCVLGARPCVWGWCTPGEYDSRVDSNPPPIWVCHLVHTTTSLEKLLSNFSIASRVMIQVGSLVIRQR